MRTREEIENSGVTAGGMFIGEPYEKSILEVILEVLLDIRDLLDKSIEDGAYPDSQKEQ